MINTFIGSLGHFLVILSFVSSLIAAFAFFKAGQGHALDKQQAWLTNARVAFFTHFAATTGVIIVLFTIIYNHMFEYHYAWNHSSRHLPVYYMISCFWEGQEGSFLLWIFWQASIGLVLIKTNKKWEAPVMMVFSFVQLFLTSMILGVVIGELKIGSSPFILLRDAMPDAPIFKSNPNFVPEDGTGLNPLLQNYWMVIHPPTLFLGFAATLVPFAYAIAGLWTRNYKEWVRPALPWALFAGLTLGVGIIMGAYWAYETLNFGGYWNWDPVENAVYIPWLVLIGSIHTLIIFKKSNTALKASFILVISTFILVLYATFLVRSGILGDASVHSFTDLGLSGQLLLYLLFFTVGALVLSIVRWKEIPSTKEEVSTYSREFWIFIGVTVLCLMGFQVLIPTSFPVFNSIIELFGGISNLAPPAEPEIFYSKFQLYFAIAIALLSGTGQFFYWRKMSKEELKKVLITPLLITMVLSALAIVFSGITSPIYILTLIAGIYSIVSNGKIAISLWKSGSGKLLGGSITHIGVAMILVGVMFSSAYDRVISINTTGLLLFKDAPEESNLENVVLWNNEPRDMRPYTVTYKGERVEVRGVPGYVDKNLLKGTEDPYTALAREDILYKGQVFYAKGESVEIVSPENSYYEVEFLKSNGRSFTLFPRGQINPSMGGLIASPDLKRYADRDLYVHVSAVADPTIEREWSKTEEYKVSPEERFFINDYVAVFESVKLVNEVEDVKLNDGDLAIQAQVRIYTKYKEYLLEPIYLIRDKMVGRVSVTNNDLGIKINLIEVSPEENTFTFGVNTSQKDYIILKAIEKPWINILWIGTILLTIGFIVAINRRYTEFMKMRDKAE